MRRVHRPPRLRRRAGRGTVLLIATLLVCSAGVRLGGGAGQALAEAGKALAPEAAPVTEGAAHSVPPVKGERRAELAALLEALQAREEKVTEREAAQELRARDLEVAEAEVRKRLDQLQEMEDRLRATLALADSAAEDDLARLTAVYENMKPKEAAALFATMEPAFAAGFLGRMRPDAAAGLMAGLPPDVAYSISVILAGRNANAPKS